MKHFVICLLLALCFGCSSRPKTDLELRGITSYGAGVLYFHSTDGEFATSLADYAKAHPDIRIWAIAPDIKDRNSVGYFVYVRNANGYEAY